MKHVRTKAFVLLIASLVATDVLVANAATVTPLFSQLLQDVPGREVSMITVEYEPAASTPLHRHNAHTFVYVLEGAIMMQVEGGVLTTVNEGEVFYETPDDIHTVSRNASETAGARFLVFFIKHENAPSTVVVD